MAKKNGITVARIGDAFAAEVSGVDLADVPAAETIAEIKLAWWDNAVLVFRKQQMTGAQQVAFSRNFGELQGHTISTLLLAEHPEILVLSNRGTGGVKPVRDGGAYWHSDITYEEIPPMGSILYGITLPPQDGDTLFADMTAAYDALEDETKAAIEGRIAIHNYAFRYQKMVDSGGREPVSAKKMAEWQDIEHPIVRTHPETGRKALFINEGFTLAIKGMEAGESRALLDHLFAHCCEPRFVYSHAWQQGDVVMWDNRCTMHCATPYEHERYERTMHRTTIRGTKPY